MLATLEENSPFISKAFHRKERASWEIWPTCSQDEFTFVRLTIFVGSHSRGLVEATHSGGMVRRNMACVAPLVNDEVSHYRIPLAPSAACVAFHFLFPVSRHTEFFINVHLPFSKIGCRLCRVLYIALANGDVSLCPPISLFQRRHHFWEMFFFLAVARYCNDDGNGSLAWLFTASRFDVLLWTARTHSTHKRKIARTLSRSKSSSNNKQEKADGRIHIAG